MLIYERSQRSAQQTADVARASDPARPRPPVAALTALFALLLVYLGLQAATYGLTNPDLAFQSPYCTIAPANYAPIIAYMEQEHIRYAWATKLLGYQISFETNNQIIMADPLARIHPSIAINRIPTYTDAIANADRPSFLVFAKHGDPHPYLLQLLDAEHVTYKAAFFPSQPGVDVMVVTPVSRMASPFESPSFDIFYCSIR